MRSGVHTIKCNKLYLNGISCFNEQNLFKIHTYNINMNTRLTLGLNYHRIWEKKDQISKNYNY